MVAETGLLTSFLGGSTGFQQSAGPHDSAADDIFVGRKAGLCPKAAAELTSAEIELGRQCGERQVLLRIFPDVAQNRRKRRRRRGSSGPTFSDSRFISTSSRTKDH